MKLQLLRFMMIGLVSFSSGFAVEKDNQILTVGGEEPWDDLTEDENVMTEQWNAVFGKVPKKNQVALLSAIVHVVKETQLGDKSNLERLIKSAYEPRNEKRLLSFVIQPVITCAPIAQPVVVDHNLSSSTASPSDNVSTPAPKGIRAAFQDMKNDVSALVSGMFLMPGLFGY